MELTIELACGEETILREIADPEMTQRDVAQTYAFLIRQDPTAITYNWRRINREIIERWSESGLERIKQAAWTGMFRGRPLFRTM